MQDWPERERYTAEDLLQIIRILRDRENGCPWDKVQTHASIRKNFLEETCEALEAIDADDAAMMREELGDVLMQVAFHAVIEEERGRFDFEQVCREVCEKLVFRHPNIFASSAAENAGINSWDALKNKEKGRTTLADELNTVPATLPALMYAQKMQKRGFSGTGSAYNGYEFSAFHGESDMIQGSDRVWPCAVNFRKIFTRQYFHSCVSSLWKHSIAGENDITVTICHQVRF